jgi:hypothetical protein
MKPVMTDIRLGMGNRTIREATPTMLNFGSYNDGHTDYKARIMWVKRLRLDKSWPGGEQVFPGWTIQTLESMQKSHERPLNAPAALEARLNAEENAPISKYDLTTTTLIATGRTRRGRDIYVVAHDWPSVISYGFLAEGLYQELKSGSDPNSYGLLSPIKLPDEHFQAMLEMEDGRPFSEEKAVYVISKQQVGFEHYGYKIPNPAVSLLLTAFSGGEKRKMRLIEMQEKSGEGINIQHTIDSRVESGNFARFLQVDSPENRALSFNIGYSNWGSPFISVKNPPSIATIRAYSQNIEETTPKKL